MDQLFSQATPVAPLAQPAHERTEDFTCLG
jgi:hypothetical protein